MSFFELATDDVITVETEDKKDFILLKADLSKAEFNKLALQGPRTADDAAGGLNFMDKIVETFVKGWSFKDADGVPIEFDMKVYKKLKTGPANWISGKAVEQFNKLSKAEVEDAEGKDENSES